jgi:hypothetical protein
VKRLVNILGAVLTAALLSAGVAAAASLALSTGLISAGKVAVAGCTSSSLTATRNVDNNGNVTQVNVLGVPQACAGQTLAVTLMNSAHTSLGSSSTVIGACTGGCTVTVTGGVVGVSATNLTAYALSLVQ